jgi:two-component system, OmpR family, response regulator RegX3
MPKHFSTTAADEPKALSIVFVEDNEFFAQSVIDWLRSAGYVVEHFVDCQSSWAYLQANHSHKFCLFDWSLPDGTGGDLVTQIQNAKLNLPVIFLTANDDPHQIRNALLIGADDYVSKPVDLAVLDARIQAVWRRYSHAYVEKETVNEFMINYNTAQIFRNGVPVKLTSTELNLALLFFRFRGTILTRDQLMNEIGTPNSQALITRRVDVHVSHLREKLQLTGEYGWQLGSVYGQGYRLCDIKA